MKLRTLMLSTALGMAATGAIVWSAVQPQKAGTPVATAPVKPPTPPKPVDHSHFQAGKTLMVEGRLGHGVLPANADSETFLFVDVQGANVIAKTPAPLDLAIVIDKSGSMAGKRMKNALAAAKTAIERLRDGDVVSVVSFNTGVEVVAPPTTIDATSRPQLIAKLQTVHAGGDTCISCGIDSAMTQLAQRTDMVERILLLSDGEPTAGVRDVDGFKRIAENCRRMGASVTTIGVDIEYDEKVMSAIARSSNGHHFFVGDPTGLPTIFDTEMASLTKTVANKAELTVDLAPGVIADRVFDRSSTISSGSQVVVPLGSFSAGDHKTVLVHVRVPRGDAGERPIAAVRLHYDDLADSTKPGDCEGALGARLTTVASEISPLDSFVSARLSASEAAGVLEASNALFKQGKNEEAQGLIAQERAKMVATRHAAIQAAPSPAAAAEADKAFDRNDAALGSGAGGFERKVGVSRPAADPAGQAQVRKNQQTAVDATE